MPGLGYPDWQRGTTNFAYPLISDTRLATVAGHNFGTFYVGNWSNLSVGFNNHDAIALDTITLTWFDANSSIVGTGKDLIVFGSKDNASVTVPIKAPFVQVGLSATQNATLDTQTLMYGTNANLTPLNSDGTNYHMFYLSQAYGAFQTAGPFGMNFWYTGWAQLMTTANTTGGGNVRLSYLNSSNTSTQFAQFPVSFSDTVSQQHVYIPPNPILITINNAGTAQTILTVLSPAPRR